MQIDLYCAIFVRDKKKSFNLSRLQVLFGRTINAKLSIFKAKYERESCFSAK